MYVYASNYTYTYIFRIGTIRIGTNYTYTYIVGTILGTCIYIHVPIQICQIKYETKYVYVYTRA